jgi:nucleotide-binding universal stress UspA family protein
MKLPSIILVPTDFSAVAEDALRYAVALAKRLDARLVVLDVIGIPALGVPELGLAVTSAMIESTVIANRATLDELVENHCKGVPCEPLLRTGDARDVINAVATEVKADLIVMGSHGRRGIARFVLGSVAEAVVRTAPCPVLTVRVPH